MGATEVFHGVSGGTVAIIFDIYQEFLNSITEIDKKAWKLLRASQYSQFWKKINGNFLATLLAGIITGLFSVLWIIIYLYEHYFIPTSSFFFSLFVITTLLMLRRIQKWDLRTLIFLLVGTLSAYGLTITPPLSSADNLLTALISGFLSVCSLAIPGLSGAFILLLIGKYQYIITSFRNLDIAVIVTFLTGCCVGLWSVARFIQWMLAHYHKATVALLAGLMIGSLNKIWPWRNVMEYALNSKGDQIPAQDKSILPWSYMAQTGKDPQIFQAVLMMAIGVFMVVLIEKIAARLKTKI
jgi:putative membrane protein